MKLQLWEIRERNFIWLCVYILGQDLVSKPPLQVQEVVEKWRNSPRATCCFEWVAPLRFSSNYCLGFSTNSESAQRQPHFTSEQQSPKHDCAFVVFGKLLLVLDHELYDASAAFGSASPQLCHKRWDDILKEIYWAFNRTILVKSQTCQYPHFADLVCAMRTLRNDFRSQWSAAGWWTSTLLCW